MALNPILMHLYVHSADTLRQLLTAVNSSPRAALQSETLASAKAYEREMRRRLQRMNIIGAGLELRAVKTPSTQGRGGLPPGVEQPFNLRGWDTRGTAGLRSTPGENDSGFE
jgi:hypothetical protein